MSATSWPTAFAEMIRHEGGYVNHKDDPGGMTNLGVTRRVWEEWTGKPIPKPPVLDANLWELMFAMLGLGGLRTIEKLRGVASK